MEKPIKSAGDGAHLLALRFAARAERLKDVRAAVFKAVTACGCCETVARDVVLAVDEACQNIIRHAYAGNPEGEIELEIQSREGLVEVLLRDFAATIDVEMIKPRDLDDVRPGGLGTHFMGAIMDQIEFLPPPKDRGNLLRMAKRIA